MMIYYLSRKFLALTSLMLQPFFISVVVGDDTSSDISNPVKQEKRIYICLDQCPQESLNLHHRF